MAISMTRIITVVVSLAGSFLFAPSEAFAANSQEVVPTLGGTSAAVAMRTSVMACRQALHHPLSLRQLAFTSYEESPLFCTNVPLSR